MKHTDFKIENEFKNSTQNLFKSGLDFLKSSLSEINPWQNIKTMHTNIRGDIMAGITVAIIALPLALAFGEMSQLGPVAGIWGAIAGGIIGGIFGGSLVGVSGPTAPKAAQIAAFMSVFVIGTTGAPDLVAAFSIIFLSGLILVAISLLKIARFIHYTPYSVVAGFMCGIGVIVILTQINAFVGLEAEKDIKGVFVNLSHTLSHINIDALYVAIPSLIILFTWPLLERHFQKLAIVPAPLIALIIGTAIAGLLDLDIPFIGDKMGVDENARIFSFYLPDLSRFSEFMVPALALAGLAVLDSLLSCIIADNMTGDRHSSDRETFGQGMANIAAGLFGGVTTATATMRTVANIKFGGKTPLASVVHGLTLLAILLGLSSMVASIPTACLAAILFKVGVDILDYRILPVIKKLPLTDLLVFGIVLVVTVYEDLMVAMAIGVVLAFFRFVMELSKTYRHRMLSLSEIDCPLSTRQRVQLSQLPACILQPQGPLFFGSVEPLMAAYRNAKPHEKLIVDMGHITMADLSGIFALEDVIKEAQTQGKEVFVANASDSIKKTIAEMKFIEHIGEKNFMDTLPEVIPNLLDSFGITGYELHSTDLSALSVPVLQQLQIAINTHNLEKTINLYHEEAVLIPAFSESMITGKKNIKEFYRGLFEKDKIRIDIIEVTRHDMKDQIIDIGSYRMSWIENEKRISEVLRFSITIKEGLIIIDQANITSNIALYNQSIPFTYQSYFNLAS